MTTLYDFLFSNVPAEGIGFLTVAYFDYTSVCSAISDYCFNGRELKFKRCNLEFKDSVKTISVGSDLRLSATVDLERKIVFLSIAMEKRFAGVFNLDALKEFCIDSFQEYKDSVFRFIQKYAKV